MQCLGSLQTGKTIKRTTEIMYSEILGQRRIEENHGDSIKTCLGKGGKAA